MELVESLKKFCASTRLPPTPLLLFPEEEATNGREGLLRFRWVSTGPWLQWGGLSSSWVNLPLFISSLPTFGPIPGILNSLVICLCSWTVSLFKANMSCWLDYARIPSYSLFLSSWPFSIQDVVQPLTLQVQRPLVSVVSAYWAGYLGVGGRRLEGKFPTSGPGLDLTSCPPFRRCQMPPGSQNCCGHFSSLSRCIK